MLKKLGIKKLPANLEKALELLKKSDFVRRYIPQSLLDEFISIRENNPDPSLGA